MILLDVQDQILDYIKNHFGEAFAMSVVLGVVIVSAAIWFSIFLYKTITKHKENKRDIEKIQKDIDKLPCAEHSAKLERIIAVETKVSALPCSEHMEQIRHHADEHNSVLTRLGSIDTTLMFLQKGIDGLNQSLHKGNQILTDSFTQSHSPLSITTQGQEMIDRLGVGEMFEANWPRINALIQNEAIGRNPYDIQQFCIQQAVVFPEKFLSNAELDKLKTDAYNTGNPLLSYMKVIAVMARDRYFKENNIDVSEVDANDPIHK